MRIARFLLCLLPFDRLVLGQSLSGPGSESLSRFSLTYRSSMPSRCVSLSPLTISR